MASLITGGAVRGADERDIPCSCTAINTRERERDAQRTHDSPLKQTNKGKVRGLLPLNTHLCVVLNGMHHCCVWFVSLETRVDCILYINNLLHATVRRAKTRS